MSSKIRLIFHRKINIVINDRYAKVLLTFEIMIEGALGYANTRKNFFYTCNLKTPFS